MRDTNKKIDVYFNRGLYSNYCTFNLSNQFILHGSIYSYNDYDDYCNYCIWIYSTQTKNMIWTYEKENQISKDFKLIGISKDKDKFYLLSNNSIYEWNVHTGRFIGGIFLNEMDKVIKYNFNCPKEINYKLIILNKLIG